LDVTTWPGAILLLGVLLMATTLIGSSMSVYLEIRKAKLEATAREDLRQLVQRYEKLAENTLDAQQRTAADVADLRSRTGSIEQILRTVD
jgi:CHASE1-domain containing sensor protein